jgi:hypothetical protein
MGDFRVFGGRQFYARFFNERGRGELLIAFRGPGKSESVKSAAVLAESAAL